MNATEQESLRKMAEGTCLEVSKSSVKGNLNLEGRMSKMLKVLCSKPQDYTHFLLMAFAKQCTEGLTTVTQF